MKLLTNIFRARQARAQPTKGHMKVNHPQVDQGDVHMVNFLLTEFRRHIIPQTCALIFLQGQIRAGHAQPEDFPLNLWDMERMYEGVYQYLEFFAILTEHETWKRMLSNWEISHELVTLLKELDAAIPKGQLSPPPLRNVNQAPPPPAPVEVDIPPPQQQQEQQYQQPQPPQEIPQPQYQPVAVERPYDTTAAGAEPYIPPTNPPSPRPYMDEAADEPSDFEWRNLKKLAVLVLSSLVWKNKHVQDQIRPLGGIEAVLNCCSYDEHNPYIREHAIMCLRFLMEGNKENQERIHALEKYNQDAKAKAESEGGGMRASAATEERARSHVNVRVPDEVLDQQGYETYMDSKGQVMLRKRQPPAQQQQQHQSLTNRDAGKGKGKIDVSSPAMSSAGMSGAGLSMGGLSSGLAGMAGMRDPKALEELVQQVMRDLPSGQGLWGGEERAVEVEEALKKLDKGFDGGMG
jgi:palmitoyltransferase